MRHPQRFFIGFLLLIGISLIPAFQVSFVAFANTPAVTPTGSGTVVSPLGTPSPTPAATLTDTPTETPIPPPTPFPSWRTGTRGKTLIVDLSDFRIYAYQDGELVRSSLVSIGRFNMATTPGDYSVLRKAELSDLTFRGVTVPDVPYILAYTDTFAIHGAYWHEDWGQRVTSGCVNLPVDEAAWYYEFAQVGTPVLVQP